MVWTENRNLIKAGFRDLEYLPRERCGWDFTLASLAFALRSKIERRPTDLARWAAAHGLAASSRQDRLGANKLVLWHGTSQERAEKIAARGLFHKGGVWTTTDPAISHSFCRNRSERFAASGAVLCLLLDREELVEGRHYEIEGAGNVYRFHAAIPAEAVEYVLSPGEIRFLGGPRLRTAAPFPRARLKKVDGQWGPIQNSPARYAGTDAYATLVEFCKLSMRSLFRALPDASALEIFSSLYACVSPSEALSHRDIWALIDTMCIPAWKCGGYQLFRLADETLGG